MPATDQTKWLPDLEYPYREWALRRLRWRPAPVAEYVFSTIELRPHVVGNDSFIAEPTLVISETPSGSFPGYSVFIAGADRTLYVRQGEPVGPGISISRQINSRSTARFVTVDTSGGAYRPARDEEIIIIETGTTRLFAGYIERVSEVQLPGTAYFECEVLCTDYGIIIDRRIIGRHYSQFLGFLLGIIVGDTINKFLSDTGISLVWTVAASTYIPEITFNYITITEEFNQLAQIAGCDWHIDDHKNLRFFTPTDGYTTAPANLTDSSDNWHSLRVDRTRTHRANRVYVKSSRSLAAVWTDSSVGNALGVYATTYIQTVKPVVKVNGTAKVVVDITQISSGAYDFYYFNGGVGAFYNPTLPALGGGDTVTIQYPSPLSWVAMAEDAASIAAVGPFERLIEVNDVFDKAQLQDIADAALARGITDPIELEFETRTAGFAPGQRLNVNTTTPLANDNFIVESVHSREVSQHFFWHTVRATNAQFQYAANPNRYYQDLISATRKPTDRIIERITFVLAETFAPFVNLGLTAGVKQPIRRAQKAGVIAWVTLVFRSIVDGTPITSNIEVDVLQNAVSIFPASARLILRPGELEAKVWVFASDPQTVSEGDTFTINVISADSTAKDGTLEVVVVG
jgi:hypothetical protein